MSVVSLDGEPIEQSRRLLITAVARSENTGQAYLDDHRAIPEHGRLPVLVEPVACKVTLAARDGLRASPLTPRGESGDEGRIAIERGQGGVTLDLSGAHSPWVLVTAE